ncbi:MAG: hypothetical protein ABII79_12270 [bacterium]
MRKVVAVFMLAVMVFIVGCAAHTHVVGGGAQGNETSQERQWYILFGIVPLNNVETDVMAAGENDYTIKTEQSALDFIMNIFTGLITVSSRTVTVSK